MGPGLRGVFRALRREHMKAGDDVTLETPGGGGYGAA